MYCGIVVLALLATCQAWVLPSQPARDPTRAGYTLYPGVGYYKFYPYWGDTGGRTWVDAQEICQQDNGHLLIINSLSEFNVLHEFFQGQNTLQYTFLGFHDLFLEGSFTTIYDEPLNRTGYDIWGRDGINGSYPSHCGVMYKRAPGLFLYGCNSLLPFFCEQELWYDYEYLTNPDGYYKLHTAGATWGEAWRTCKEEGAELAVINSFREWNNLRAILIMHPHLNADSDDMVHLGFHSKFKNTEYHVITGERLNASGYSVWAPNEPNPSGHCGGLLRDSNLYMGSCDARLAFFCEHSQ